MSDSVWPHRRQPTRLLCPWDSPGKNTGVGCHFLLQCMKVKSESEVAQSCLTLSNPMHCSLPGSSVHGIFRCHLKYPRTRTRAELSANGQGGLAGCSPWGHRRLHAPERLNNNNSFYLVFRAFAMSVVSEKITTFWGDKLCSPSLAMRIHRRQG